METEASRPTTSSAYLAYYGLTRAPFAEEVEDDLFYAEPARKQRLDLLLHLAQYGNELLLVTAPEGFGKTTLLRQFMAHALETWNVIQLDATGIPDERKLVQLICRQFTVNYQNTAHAEILQTLTHFLDGLLHNARQGVLLMDNAHHLQTTALKRLVDLASQTGKDNKPLLRVVLFGEDILAENLKDPALGDLSNIPTRHLELPPFSKEESILYILHRLSAACFADTEPFTDAALQKICKDAGGSPARLNQLSHQLLLDSLPKQLDATNNKLKGARLRRPGQLVAGIVTLSLVIAALIYQSGLLGPHDRAEQASQSKMVQAPLALPDRDTQQKTPAGPPKQTMAAKPPQQNMAEELMLPPLTTAPTPAADHEPEIHAEASPYREAETGQPAPTMASSHAPAAAKGPEQMQAPAAPTAAITPEQATAQAEVKTAAAMSELPQRREDWIRRQAPSAYTLQLIAGRHTDTLKKFMAQHGLDGHGELAFYEATREGAPWYGLIYGVYADKQAAIDARSRLPQQLRKLKPWVRNMGELQNSLP